MIKTMWRFCWIPEIEMGKKCIAIKKRKTAETLTLTNKSKNVVANRFCAFDPLTLYLPENWKVKGS